MERNGLRSAAQIVCSVNNFLCILTPFFHSLFASLILFPSYTHAGNFSGFIILSRPGYHLPMATCQWDPPSGRGVVEDRFAEQEPPPLALGWRPLLSVGEHGCFPAAPASLPALSTAVALRNAARRRENALQPDTEELRAVAHLFFPLVAGCELLGE